MAFFSIENIFIKFWDYPISYLEFMGTLFGLISVYLASKSNILTWPTGIINEILLFILFFQVQLYADMFLQVYFLIMTIYGWHYWSKQSKDGVSVRLSVKNRVLLIALLLAVAIPCGFLFSNIHLYLPNYFKIPAAYPFADSFVVIFSIMATILLAKKMIETWYLWICADVIAVVIYFQREVYFLSFEYLILLFMASYGFFNWRKKMING